MSYLYSNKIKDAENTKCIKTTVSRAIVNCGKLVDNYPMEVFGVVVAAMLGVSVLCLWVG